MNFNKSFMYYMRSFCKGASYVEKVANAILKGKECYFFQVNYFSHYPAALHRHPKKLKVFARKLLYIELD